MKNNELTERFFDIFNDFTKRKEELSKECYNKIKVANDEFREVQKNLNDWSNIPDDDARKIRRGLDSLEINVNLQNAITRQKYIVEQAEKELDDIEKIQFEQFLGFISSSQNTDNNCCGCECTDDDITHDPTTMINKGTDWECIDGDAWKAFKLPSNCFDIIRFDPPVVVTSMKLYNDELEEEN